MRELSQPTTRSLNNFSGRTVSEPSARSLSDDGDDFRALSLNMAGFTYTFPITFPDADIRDLADTE